MPKTNEGRTVDSEANLARRIEMLRTDRGWSYERLAREMTDVGCKIQATALHKVEKGDKKTGKLRRITVNELSALSKVFGISTDNLLTDIALIEQERAHELIKAVGDFYKTFGDVATKAFDSLVALYELAYNNQELAEYVANHLSAGKFTTSYELGPDPVDEDGEAVGDLVLLRAIKADHDHQRALRHAARMWAAYRAGDWTDDDQRNTEAELVALREEVDALGMKVTYEDMSETDNG